MRRLLACTLVALTALPALAQSNHADSSGVFVAVQRLSVGAAVSFFSERGVDATLGYRFGNGVDAGLRVARRSGFAATTVSVAPTAGVTRLLGRGAAARVEGTVRGSRSVVSSDVFVDGNGTATFGDVRLRSIEVDLTATLSQTVRLGGSMRLRPTAGVFGRTVSTQFDLEALASGTSADAGVHLSLPLSFRLFGADVTVAPTVRLVATDGFRVEPASASAFAGGGLRLNF